MFLSVVFSPSLAGPVDVYGGEENRDFGGPVQKQDIIAVSAGGIVSPGDPRSLDSQREKPLLIAADTAVLSSADPLSDLRPAGSGFRKYTIKKGDTILGVADRFHISKETLLSANPDVH